ncbi:Flp family type IVb pilin [Vibrio taketomensis]|uniref:Flp family type IVb pilin n=1 Tax=Vibrio taketomensis TaxID=2572923 RepID=UPI0013894BA4|nr:Flp family type IVb pilin [Vibrio taketomensis]
MLTKLFINTQLAVEKFRNDQRGVTAIEYAIIGVAVSALVLAVFASDTTGLKKALTDAMGFISDNITAAK